MQCQRTSITAGNPPTRETAEAVKQLNNTSCETQRPQKKEGGKHYSTFFKGNYRSKTLKREGGAVYPARCAPVAQLLCPENFSKDHQQKGRIIACVRVSETPRKVGWSSVNSQSGHLNWTLTPPPPSQSLHRKKVNHWKFGRKTPRFQHSWSWQIVFFFFPPPMRAKNPQTWICELFFSHKYLVSEGPKKYVFQHIV